MIRRNLVTLCVAAIAITMIASSEAEAQRGGRDFGSRMFGGFGGGPVDMLQREDVQAELKLTDGQIEEIRELAESARERRREQFSGFNFREQSEEQRRELFSRMRERMEEQAKEQTESIGSILNSKQNERLKELAFQYQLNRGRTRDALVAGGVELSDEDREKLEEARRKIDEKTNAQIAEIRRNAQKEIMATVISERQIERLMGNPFEFTREEPRFGGRGSREDRGGREGDRARRRPEAEEDSEDNEDNNRRRRRRRE